MRTEHGPKTPFGAILVVLVLIISAYLYQPPVSASKVQAALKIGEAFSCTVR